MANNPFYNAQRAKHLENMKYKKKYARLKRLIKDYVFENASLCDQISQIQENIAIIKEERRFLLTKLVEYENDGETPMPPTPNSNAGEPSSAPAKRGPKKRLNSDGSIRSKSSNGSKSNNSSKKQPAVQQITVDQQGMPVYPICIGNLTIHSIGEIVAENTNFHNEKWIYPLGFTSTRVYAHPKEPERKCTFTCKILDNSGTPQFQIIPEADFDHVFFGESADVCHLGLLEAIVRVSDIKNLPLRPQGEVFFGLGNPSVVSLIQSLPNAKKCANFKGFQIDSGIYAENDADPTLNFDALQKLIVISAYHSVPEIKEEPPDELLEE